MSIIEDIAGVEIDGELISKDIDEVDFYAEKTVKDKYDEVADNLSYE